MKVSLFWLFDSFVKLKAVSKNQDGNFIVLHIVRDCVKHNGPLYFHYKNYNYIKIRFYAKNISTWCSSTTQPPFRKRNESPISLKKHSIKVCASLILLAQYQASRVSE